MSSAEILSLMAVLFLVFGYMGVPVSFALIAAEKSAQRRERAVRVSADSTTNSVGEGLASSGRRAGP